MVKYIKDIVARLKTLWRIAGSYDSELAGTYNSIAFLAKMLKDRTDVGVDMGCGGGNYAIVVGRIKMLTTSRHLNLGGESLLTLLTCYVR